MNENRKEYRTQIRFPADLWDHMKKLAQEHDRSLNGEVVWALRHYIQDQEGKDKNAHHEKDQA
ncbi:MAG: Arc family DNA-binding protein [Ktedonobacteraceae bacterium]